MREFVKIYGVFHLISNFVLELRFQLFQIFDLKFGIFFDRKNSYFEFK